MSNMIAATQSLVIVGSYAATDQPGIQLFCFDNTTGTLTASGALAGITNPSFVVMHPRRPWLYAVSETSIEQDGRPGSVWALSVERAPLGLQPINHQPSGGDAPCHLQIDTSGRWLLVSNYSSGTVAVLPILADGSLGTMTDLVQHSGSSVSRERQAGPHAHSSTFTPDQRFVVVADLGMDQLLVYAFDSVAGKLNLHSQIDTQPGSGPRHIAFHPGGHFAYVASELNNSVSLYDYDAESGTLRERQTLATIPPEVPENSVADIHVAPSGHRVYVSNRGHDSIAVFDVTDDGQLERIAIVPCGGSWPRHFALVPGGKFMLVANQRSGDVVLLPLVADRAAISASAASAAVPGAACVAWGADL